MSALQGDIEELEAQLNRTKQINTELQSEVNLKLQEWVIYRLSKFVRGVSCQLFLSSYRANETYDKIKKEHASEAAVFKASLRKMTLEADGLKNSLIRK